MRALYPREMELALMSVQGKKPQLEEDNNKEKQQEAIKPTLMSDSFRDGGFKNQPQQLMFSSRFSQFHVEKELAINLYR